MRQIEVILFVASCMMVSMPPLISAVTISSVNGVVTCDGLYCPADTDTCRVTRRSTSDRRSIITRRQCLQDGEILKQHNSRAPNRYGGDVNSVSQSRVGGSGSRSSYSSSSSSGTTTTVDGNGRTFVRNYQGEEANELGRRIAQQTRDQIRAIENMIQGSMWPF